MSGWRYREWRKTFYPKKLAQKRELEFIGSTFASVELNGSFYSLQRPSSYVAWAGAVPEDFVFAVKGSRFITHMKRLRDVDSALANFFASGVLALGRKLGPIVWQLPASQIFDAPLFDAFFRQLPKTTTAAAALAKRHDARLDGRAFVDATDRLPLLHALEPRHASFGTSEARALLEAHGIALVVADTAKKFPTFEATRAGFTYVRLHGGTELYWSGYGPKALDTWAKRIDEWRARGDVYVYFDNSAAARAPFDAMSLGERFAERARRVASSDS